MSWNHVFSNPLPRDIREVAERVSREKERVRLLPALTAAYNLLPPQQQERVVRWEAQFEAKPEAFITWARTVVPGAFSSSSSSKLVVATKLAVSPGAEAVEDLPDWVHEDVVYHGTGAAHLILTEGLCNRLAMFASGDDYGWLDVWQEEVWGSYSRDLKPEQKRKFRDLSGLSGKRVGKKDLGENTSLFWVTKKISAAKSHGTVLRVNLLALRYYWWFPDEILGDQSYVFVLPTNCPQALPEAFEVVR